MRVSIIINTLDRATFLSKTLHSLQYLEYPDFEVIVVNGPSTDHTEAVLKPYQDIIKIGHCPVKNLSVSRNIGIAMAAGEVVAFIDDDAIPEPEWLNKLVTGYDDEEIAGVGGSVYDNTGYAFQWQYTLGNRIEGHKILNTRPNEHFCFPGSLEFVSMAGTNATFRRDLLLRVGGFDEQYDYCFDETDVCVRLVNAGYVIRHMEGAYVHHKFAPSHLRKTKVMTNFFPSVKNLIYFLHKNYFPFFEDKTKMLERVFNAAVYLQNDVQKNYTAKELNEIEREQALISIYEGLNQGFLDTLNPRKLIQKDTLRNYRIAFKPYRSQFSFNPTHLKQKDILSLQFLNQELNQRLVICLLTTGYPPHDYWGIARCTQILATYLARQGHHVHVVCHSVTGINTVDYEEGVWVHAIVRNKEDPIEVPKNCLLPADLWKKAVAGYREVNRIKAHHGRIDIVQVPIWLCEGLPFLNDNYYQDKLVTSLYTTYAVEKSISTHWQNNLVVHDALNQMIAAEKYVIENSPFIYANTQAIIDTTEHLYKIRIPQEKYGYQIIPHTVFDVPQCSNQTVPAKNHRSSAFNYVAKKMFRENLQTGIDVLFVGRLQTRKGIGTLLACIPEILKENKQVRFLIVGNDTLINEQGKLYKDEFLKQHSGNNFLKRVIFTGQVNEENLLAYYANCDLLVAPSVYESFGLIFLEAMRFSKPVIGCKAGGMQEIIEHNVNGFLVEPNDPHGLKNALQVLIKDSRKRKEFGLASRRIYETKFSEKQLVEKSLNFYQRIVRLKSYHE